MSISWRHLAIPISHNVSQSHIALSCNLNLTWRHLAISSSYDVILSFSQRTPRCQLSAAPCFALVRSSAACAYVAWRCRRRSANQRPAALGYLLATSLTSRQLPLLSPLLRRRSLSSPPLLSLDSSVYPSCESCLVTLCICVFLPFIGSSTLRAHDFPVSGELAFCSDRSGDILVAMKLLEI